MQRTKRQKYEENKKYKAAKWRKKWQDSQGFLLRQRTQAEAGESHVLLFANGLKRRHQFGRVIWTVTVHWSGSLPDIGQAMLPELMGLLPTRSIILSHLSERTLLLSKTDATVLKSLAWRFLQEIHWLGVLNDSEVSVKKYTEDRHLKCWKRHHNGRTPLMVEWCGKSPHSLTYGAVCRYFSPLGVVSKQL